VVRRKDENESALGRPVSPAEGAVEAVACVRTLQERLKISDSALARLVGVNQSSVHRALSRKPPRLTPTLSMLCNYAKKRLRIDGAHQVDSGRDQLARAVAGVWDGSPEGLNKLLALLRDLSDLVSRD
jgi:transcriptional regulator with XRE-family HTH domain